MATLRNLASAPHRLAGAIGIAEACGAVAATLGDHSTNPRSLDLPMP